MVIWFSYIKKVCNNIKWHYFWLIIKRDYIKCRTLAKISSVGLSMYLFTIKQHNLYNSMFKFQYKIYKLENI